MFNILNGFTVSDYYEIELNAQYTMNYIILYTLAMVLSFFVTGFGIRITLTIRAYHPNVNRLFCFALAMWLLIFLSKICRFLFYIRRQNDSDAVDSHFLLLQTSAFTRYIYFYFSSATPLAATVERGFATLLLSDYEKTSRLPIFLLIAFINLSIAFLFTVLSVVFNIQFSLLMFVTSLYLLVCFVLLTILYTFNLSQFNRLNKYHREEYSLSRRFQLQENIRILSLLMKMIYAVIALIAAIVAGYVLPVVLNFDHLTRNCLRNIVDFLVHCNPLIVIPMTIYFIPEYRRNARALLFNNVSLSRSSNQSNYRGYRDDGDQADVHFDIFKRSIKIHNQNSSRNSSRINKW